METGASSFPFDVLGMGVFVVIFVCLLLGWLFAGERRRWFSFTTTPLTLNELWERSPDAFAGGEDRWWKDEPFANERGGVRKLLLLTSPVRGSRGETWEGQQRLLSAEEEVPTVRDLVEGIIACYKEKGTWLFSYRPVRTRSISSDNEGSGARGDYYRIEVEVISGCIQIITCWNLDRNEHRGVAAVQPIPDP